MADISKYFSRTEANHLFASETLMRQNRNAVRAYCYEIFHRRNLPLSNIALTFYLTLAEEYGKEMRKDAQTPREQHEESHIITMDALLNTVGRDWIDAEKYGSIDALFAAIVLHDVVEDFKVSPQFIDFTLRQMSQRLYEAKAITDDEFPQSQKDIKHVIEIVGYLSRKDENGTVFAEDDRISQAKQWLRHPYAFPIKQIDWCNKLQTMPNVEHFEKNSFARMAKVVGETSFLFVDEQQAMTRRALKAYPFLQDVCAPMEGVMGMLFQTLNTYVKLKSESFGFDPKEAYPFNFSHYLAKARPLLEILPKGNNYISPFIDRIDANGENDQRARAFLNHMIKPAFEEDRDLVNIFITQNPLAPARRLEN